MIFLINVLLDIRCVKNRFYFLLWSISLIVNFDLILLLKFTDNFLIFDKKSIRLDFVSVIIRLLTPVAVQIFIVISMTLSPFMIIEQLRSWWVQWQVQSLMLFLSIFISTLFILLIRATYFQHRNLNIYKFHNWNNYLYCF